MTATLSVEPRRTGKRGAPPTRELPVLFHLMDVSSTVSRPAATILEPPPDPPAASKPPDTPPTVAAYSLPEPAMNFQPPPSPFPPPLPEPPRIVERPAVTAIVEASPPIELPPTEPPAIEPLSLDLPATMEVAIARPETPIEAREPQMAEQPPIESAPDFSSAIREARAAEVEANSRSVGEESACGNADSIFEETLETAPLPAVEPGTVTDSTPPGEPQASTAKKARPRVRDTWFAAHGKYIAIGFVLALIGTILLARFGRRAPQPVADALQHSHPGDAGEPFDISLPKPVTVVDEAAEDKQSGGPADGTAESSPAKLTEQPADEPKPQTDLHPPTIPQLASEPSDSNQPPHDNLFPWGQPNENRLATRPEPTLQPPANSPRAQPQYPVTEQSAGVPPGFPVTNSPYVEPPQAGVPPAINGGRGGQFVPPPETQPGPQWQPGPPPPGFATDYR
ncbi:MAG TPA: hypothetical protein VFV87_10680, partial [Pirellulaceae bacterium]|nr:hypothetical protein [Pirellulaceae bacterium]